MVTFIVGIWLMANLIGFICILIDSLIYHIPAYNPIDDIRIALYSCKGIDAILILESVVLFPALYLAYIVLKILR